MFDPAFAGKPRPAPGYHEAALPQHLRALDVFPSQCDDEFDLSCKVINDEIIIEHSFKITARCDDKCSNQR